MMEHRGGVNRFKWMQRLHQLGVNDTGAMLQNSSFSFDASVWELLWPLSSGARVVLSPPQAHRDLDRLVETIRRSDVRAAFFVPSMLQLLVESGGVAESGLRRVMCGGEPFPPALARRMEELLPGVELFNMFGPSEASQAVTGRVQVQEGDATVPLGRPNANTRIYILDENGAPVPVGVPGELYVGGVQMARGYLDRPGLTADRFLPDPYVDQPGARVYRTGDLGRWRRDGRIEFLGRMDFQVKVRGFRIEPAEIEARLGEHPAVRAAVVLAREDTPGEKRLVAYVVADETAGADVLRAYLSELLPEYMVPAAYVRLDALPLTPNGKLDRKALPAPEGDVFATRAYEAPVGETEQALAEIWCDVLRIDRVGRWDDFFDLGGHSLLAVRVISRVRQMLGVEIALGDVFTRPVLRDFARALETAARSELPPIEPAPRDGRLPLSFAQQRLWFLEQLGGLGSTYHIHKRRRLRGALDRAALCRALDGIVARHEALRTTFAQVDGIPEQRIAPADVGLPLVEHDLVGRTDADAEFDRLRAEEARAPFDLARGPLIRGRLIRLAEDDHVLLVTMHHIVSDAWSSGVFFDEFATLYAAHREEREADQPRLPVQYADYAIWQRRWVEGEVLQVQADYWTRTLAGAPELLDLPTDHPRPAKTDHAGALFGVELDETLTAGLKALARRHGTTLFMTLLAGWSVVLSRLSGQSEVVIGTPTANRGRREIEGLIGFFINTLALRLDLSDSPTVAELLARVKERTLEAQHHQDIPFEQVVELVDPVRSLSHNPLFQVNLT
ncbi:MAG TPA: condensation domain-containing protein, partial [Longimicrobium sp.]|nr:condensation domain-containing protein [Longimicrobium sp.]